MIKPLVIETWGGIGDCWLATPAIRALKEDQPDRQIWVYCMDNHLEILENNPHIDFFSSVPEDPHFQNTGVMESNYGRLRPSITSTQRATEIIADLFGVSMKEDKLVIVLTEEEEAAARDMVAPFDNPVSIHTTSGSQSYKDWPNERWEELMRCRTDCTFIQLGLKEDSKVEGAVDMRGRTTIRQAIGIVKYSKCYVGVDSFLNHATNAVGTPGVVLFGPSTPTVWGHAGNTNIYKDVECAPCVDVIDKNSCPNHIQCMTRITVHDVLEAMSRYV